MIKYEGKDGEDCIMLFLNQFIKTRFDFNLPDPERFLLELLTSFLTIFLSKCPETTSEFII